MLLIITMAGESSRFGKMGFSSPKYELKVHSSFIFDLAISSLKSFYSSSSFLFVCKKGAGSFIRSRATSLGLTRHEILELAHTTEGQATTALLGLQYSQHKGPFAIYNIDTYIKPDALKPEHISAESDGFLPVFEAPGDHWSFAEVLDGNRVSQVAEKRRISPYATVGFYYFSDAHLFESAYKRTYHGALQNETYVAPLYNALISEGRTVTTTMLQHSDIIPLGTPDEATAYDPDFMLQVNRK